MSDITIEVTGAQEAAQYFTDAASALVPAVSVRLAEVCQEIANYAQMIAPKRSGEYAASIYMAQDGPLRFRIGATAAHSAIVEWGSMPHIILPRTARVLHFEVDGEEVFAKFVMHPGTRPMLIIHTAKKDNMSKIVAAIHEGVKEALGKGGG